MDISRRQYSEYVKEFSPNSNLALNMFNAFWTGGLICCVGQGFLNLYKYIGLGEQPAATAVSITMVFLGALFTGLHLYDNAAKIAGAGTVVPITGFANSVASPAVEFRSEGLVLGVAAKMFTIAGPVIVYGLLASVAYGLIYFISKLF